MIDFHYRKNQLEKDLDVSDSDNDCDKKKDSLIEPLSPIKDGSSDGSEESSSTESSSEESNNDNKVEPVEPGSPKIRSQWSLESFIKPNHLQNETQNATSERVQKDSEDDEKQSPVSLHNASPLNDHTDDALLNKQDHTNQTNSNLTPTMMYNKNNNAEQHTSDEPVKVKQEKKCVPDEVPSDDIHSVLAEIKGIQTIKAISSLSSSDSEDNKKKITNQLPEIPIKKIKNKRKSKAKGSLPPPTIKDRRASSDEEDFSHANVQSSTTTTTTTTTTPAKSQEKKGRGRPRKSKDRTKTTTTNTSSEKEQTAAQQKNSSASKKDHAKNKPRRKKPETKVQSKPVISSDSSSSFSEPEDNDDVDENDKISQKSYNYKMLEVPRMPDRSSGTKDNRRQSTCEDSDKR